MNRVCYITPEAVPVTNLIRAAEPNAPNHSSVNVGTEPVRQGSRGATIALRWPTGGEGTQDGHHLLTIVAGNR